MNEGQSGKALVSAPQANSRTIAGHMVDALTYLICVASDSGLKAVVARLRAARWDLILYQAGAAPDDQSQEQTD
jgi:hypothetical protein|tara:strand:- start:804 stop:1025 length:222 start_codon:yes stop_codon:yes gene_type:complete